MPASFLRTGRPPHPNVYNPWMNAIGLWMRPAILLATVSLLLTGCTGQNGSISPIGADEPEDQWAIRCIAFSGPDHATRAEHAANQLKAVRGLRADRVRVISSAEQAIVFYGRYARTEAGPGGMDRYTPDPEPDLNLIHELSIPFTDPLTGREQIVWPFRLAILAALPAKPSTHPEWQLANAPGYWSLQVGVFYNTETMQQRRYAAEEYCRLLRESGEQAWYDHGAVNSSVCIGSFPREAIQSFTRKDPLTGVSVVSARIVDEKMLELSKRFPYNTENGAIFYEITTGPDGKKKRDPHPSFAVQIPRPRGAAAPRPGRSGE